MKILLIGDNIYLRKLLLKIFSANDYQVDAASDDESGYDLLAGATYDLVVLDIMLPGIAGFDLLRKIRMDSFLVPVIALTVPDAVSDRILGLDLGADDCLTKPFSADELLARIRALLRRPAKFRNDALLSINALTLEMKSCEVHLGTDTFKLSVKEALLLELLMKNANKFVSKNMILNTIWNHCWNVEQNNVEVYIHRLRKSGFYSKSGIIIETSRGVGYRLRVKSEEYSQ